MVTVIYHCHIFPSQEFLHLYKKSVMKKILTILLTACFANMFSQKADTLVVNYFENYPYSYTEAGKAKGIEIDIISEYLVWLKKKNINTTVSYKAYKDFSEFYNSVKEGNANVVGLGSVTRSGNREQEVSFSPPYLKNVAVLITAGRISTARERSADEVNRVFSGMHAVAVKQSSHLNYLNQIKAQFLPALDIRTVESQKQVLETILSDNTFTGYVDIIAYWSFLKSNPSKFLKIQKAFSETREDFGFVMPKKNNHSQWLSEFFESGFGFTSTKTYHQILENYLGYEILESVELK